MEMTSNKALKIIQECEKQVEDKHWIKHSIFVGNSAAKIAAALKDKGHDVDVELVKTLGYIHDIGKYNGKSQGHVMRGYNYLKEKDYDEKYCNICLTHSYLNNDIKCTAGKCPDPKDNPFLDEFIKKHTYTLEEKIINLCDLMCTQDGALTIDKRLVDLITRKGAYETTQYHVIETVKLKKYFDNLLGYNVYDLFPEIKNNL